MATELTRLTPLQTLLALGALLWMAPRLAVGEPAAVLLEPGLERLPLTSQLEYLLEPTDSPQPPPGLTSANFVEREALTLRPPRPGWYWQRITLQSAFDRPSMVFLAMAPYWVDDIRVYRLEGAELVQVARHGDTVPWKDRLLPGRKHFQPQRLQPDEQVTLYLAFQVLGPLIPSLTVYDSNGLWDFGIRQDLFIGAAVAILLLSGISFLMVGVGLRMQAPVIYGAAVILSSLQVAARYGVIEATFPSTTPTLQHLANWIGGLAGAILILEASLRVFAIPEDRPHIYRGVWVIIGLALATGPLTYDWFAPYWTTVPYQVLGVLALLIMGLIIERIVRRPVRPFLLVCALAFILRLLGFLVEIYTAASIVDLGQEGFSGVLQNSIAMVVMLNIAMGMLVHAALKERDQAQAEVQRNIRRWQDQRELINMLSHEFRNPLAAISRSAQMLLSHPEFDAQRRLQGIRGSADNLYSLVERLLATESFEFRKDLLQGRPIGIGAVIQRCIDESSQPERIVFQRGREEIVVSADEQMLGLAVGNLLDNALKFSPPETSVVVNLSSMNQQAMIRVEDQGCGIETADLEQLGRPYFRADSVRKVPGLGLGFRLAHRIIEGHGGTLSVDSRPGQGTAVTIRLAEYGSPTGLIHSLSKMVTDGGGTPG